MSWKLAILILFLWASIGFADDGPRRTILIKRVLQPDAPFVVDTTIADERPIFIRRSIRDNIGLRFNGRTGSAIVVLL